jgi:hypothetical protein
VQVPEGKAPTPVGVPDPDARADNVWAARHIADSGRRGRALLPPRWTTRRSMGTIGAVAGAVACVVVAIGPFPPRTTHSPAGSPPQAGPSYPDPVSAVQTGAPTSPSAAPPAPIQPSASPSPRTHQPSSKSSAPTNAAAPLTTPKTSDPIEASLACTTGSTASFAATFTVAFDWYHVFINADADTSTGYQDSDVAGNLGADYLVENTTLYRSTGTGWNWRAIGNVSPLVSSTAGRYQWRVPLSALGTPSKPIQATFNGAGTHPDAWSSVITVGTCT